MQEQVHGVLFYSWVVKSLHIHVHNFCKNSYQHYFNNNMYVIINLHSINRKKYELLKNTCNRIGNNNTSGLCLKNCHWSNIDKIIHRRLVNSGSLQKHRTSISHECGENDQRLKIRNASNRDIS